MRKQTLFRCVAFLTLLGVQPSVKAYDALEACRASFQITDEIHDCLDNYLDLMDQNLGDLTVFIDGELRGSERAAFNRAQNSFYSYRRENCLWYLEIGGPLVLAEQVAKNCLAKMSQDRLAELQGLIAGYNNPDATGADALSSLPDTTADTTLDATPDATATIEDPILITPEGVQSASDAAAALQSSNDASQSASAADDEDKGLSAFLGEWQVNCENTGSSKRCTLDVPLLAQGASSSESIMRISRRANERTTVELRFADHTVASPELIEWRVDNYTFGPVPGSIVKLEDSTTRQIINEVKFLRDDLLPLFRSGSEVGVVLLEEPEGSIGEPFQATLLGFSRALTFADGYISGDLQ